MTLPANIRINMSAPFPATVKGGGVVAVAKANGIWTIELNFAALALLQVAPDPANTYALTYDPITGASALLQIGGVSSSKVVQTLVTVNSPYAAQPNDDVLLIENVPFTVTVDWSTRVKPLRVVDQSGAASVGNPITITPASGQTQLASVNYSYLIDGAGGSITLTPLPDGSGAY
jgi:hypothetical protein